MEKVYSVKDINGKVFGIHGSKRGAIEWTEKYLQESGYSNFEIYSKQRGDRCLLHITIIGGNGNNYRSVYITEYEVQ